MATSDSLPPNILQRWLATDSCFALIILHRWSATDSCLAIIGAHPVWQTDGRQDVCHLYMCPPQVRKLVVSTEVA